MPPGTMKTILALAAAAAASVLVAGVTAVLVGFWRFNRLVQMDRAALLTKSAALPEAVVTQEMLGGLPEPVRRYLTYTGVVGKPVVRTAHLRQTGRMHPGAAQPWFPFEAVEDYSVQPPGFVWDATLCVGALPVVRARDAYLDGHGNMLIKAGALYPIADAVGPEIDQGSMMRYLSEMIWFPTAFLGDNVSFEPIDDWSARARLTDHGRSATATMHFDEEGKLTDFVAERYRMVDGGHTLETWSTPVTEYGELAGLKLPIRGKAVWRLADGDLEYIDAAVTELEYNVGSSDPA